MSPFSASGLLACISSFFFGLLVFLKSEDKKVGRVWAAFATAVSFWGFGVFIIPYLNNPSKALLAWRLTYAIGANWIPVLFIHFVSVYCSTKRTFLIISQYIIGTVFFFLSFTPLFYSGVTWVFNSFYYSKAGEIYLINSAWWLSSVMYAHIELLSAYKSASSMKKNQIKYFFFATVVGFGGGTFDFLPPLGIELYPWGNFTIFLYPLIMSIAILRYRLMDFNLIIRWGLAYSILVFFLGGSLILITIFSDKMFHHYLGWSAGYITLIAIGSFVMVFDPLRKKITRYVDLIIFKSPDFQALLTGIEESLQTNKNLLSLSAQLTNKLKKIFGTDHAGIAVWDFKTTGYEFIPPIAFSNQIITKLKVKVDPSDFLIRTLETERRLFPRGIIIEDEVTSLANRSSPGEKTTFWKIRRTMKWVGAVICIPLMANTQLIGFLILGAKKIGTPYNDEDKKFLSHVADMISSPVRLLSNSLEPSNPV